ncbi:MAG: RNA polymerase factor sigma-54 [Methyloligellaceae bacterium]
MALSAKLELRQSQSLVMTPQLQQAIKLLQLSNLELGEFVEKELEKNPLLEVSESEPANSATAAENSEDSSEGQSKDEWLENSVDGKTNDPSNDLDTDVETVYPDGRNDAGDHLKTSDWKSTTTSGAGASESVNLEAFVSEEKTLTDHLNDQLQLSVSDPVKRLIGQHLIDMVDEAGYLRGDLGRIAEMLGAPLDLIEDTLRVLQTFDPVGVFARDLSECLALQLQDRNRYDPAIAKLLDNLHLLASHDLDGLNRVCDQSAEDLADMIMEVKQLNPKPGLKYGSVTVQPIVPDVAVYAKTDGSWHVELNSETLPRVLVNQTYYTTVSKSAKSKQDKSYIQDCFQTANWLVKSLDQRAQTILKVAEEIVRQQDAFLTHGVQHLRPLNLKTVADAISMHESTVSRVTSNKYIETNRGIFELKYFFTSAIASSSSSDSHSSEAVRHRIRQLVDGEQLSCILSDDKIVERLQQEGIEIARRTVAKYREAMQIPSSVQRRRKLKMASH